MNIHTPITSPPNLQPANDADSPLRQALDDLGSLISNAQHAAVLAEHALNDADELGSATVSYAANATIAAIHEASAAHSLAWKILMETVQ